MAVSTVRVLFTTQPALSHLYPLLPLANALAAAGHDVAFACTRPFCAAVESWGFQAFAAGMEFGGAHDETAFPEVAAAPAGPQRSVAMLRDVFAGATARAIVPDLLALTRSWKPDVIVRDPVEFGGCVAAEALRIPHATGRENRFLPPERWAAVVGEPLNDLRRAHGLPADPQMAMIYRHLALAWVPPRFISAVPLPEDGVFGTYFPPTMRFLRPAPPERGADGARLPAETESWLAERAGRDSGPIVYATLGVVWNTAPGLFETILDALRDEPLSLILTVGHDRDPAAFGPQPPHVRIERFVPHAPLARRCDLVITAGGFGTVMGTLDAGLPMVVLPIGADQPLNARRCESLGLAEVVGPQDRTPAAIRSAVRRVLDDQAYRARVAALRDEMRALPGPEEGVALLERLCA